MFAFVNVSTVSFWLQQISCQGIEANIIIVASQVFIIIGSGICWAQSQTD